MTHERQPYTLPVVAILGRTNVGKSTLFNRLTGKRRALAFNRAGVTRDRHYAEATYEGRSFIVIDTGGFEPDAPDADVFAQVRRQALIAMDEADVLLVVFDGRAGLTPGDERIVELVRGSEKPVFYVVNKIDGPGQRNDSYEFYRLGVEALYPVSSEHSLGFDPLLDDLLECLPARSAERGTGQGGIQEPDEMQEDDPTGLEETAEGLTPPRAGRRSGADSGQIKIALVGRPNTGKSSLANRWVGYEHQVVHPEAGTTRDTVELSFVSDGTEFVLLDTAGIRRKARISDKLEQVTVIKAFKAISGCDVALLLLDATQGVTAQEKRLAGMINEKGRGAAVLVNKWDLMADSPEARHNFRDKTLHDLDHIRFAPVHFLSALTGAGAEALPGLVRRIDRERHRQIPTHELNKWLEDAVEAHPHPAVRGQSVKMQYIVQGGQAPPVFLIFSTRPEEVRPDYRRYLENSMRARFGFQGSPVMIVLKGRKK